MLYVMRETKREKKVNKALNRPKNRKNFRFNHLVEKNVRKFFADILTFFISWMIQKSLMLYLHLFTSNHDLCAQSVYRHKTGTSGQKIFSSIFLKWERPVWSDCEVSLIRCDSFRNSVSRAGPYWLGYVAQNLGNKLTHIFHHFLFILRRGRKNRRKARQCKI